MKVKPVIIALLLVVNLSLLAALILAAVQPSTAYAGTAFGQAMYGSPRYLMVTGRFRENEQALYIVKLEERTLAVFTFDQQERKLQYNGRASLGADFR